MTNIVNSEIDERQHNIKEIDNFRRIILPRVFLDNTGYLLDYVVTKEGIVLSAAKEKKGKTTITVERSRRRIILPKEVLRLYGNPLRFIMMFAEGEPDKLILTPISAKCAKCGATINLHDVYNKEIFICTSCLNKICDLHIPVAYADDSI